MRAWSSPQGPATHRRTVGSPSLPQPHTALLLSALLCCLCLLSLVVVRFVRRCGSGPLVGELRRLLPGCPQTRCVHMNEVVRIGSSHTHTHTERAGATNELGATHARAGWTVTDDVPCDTTTTSEQQQQARERDTTNSSRSDMIGVLRSCGSRTLI